MPTADGKTGVLFHRGGNSRRSRIAESRATNVKGDRVEARSEGLSGKARAGRSPNEEAR